MKKIIALILLCALSVGSFSYAQDYDKVTLRMTVNGTDIANDTRAANRFAELVNEETNGSVKIRVFPNDQLAGGSQGKGVEMLSRGTVDMGAYSTSPLSLLDENLMVSATPWTFSNYADAEKLFLPENSGGKFIDGVLREKNLVYLGSVHNGFKVITCGKRLIKRPEDLQGLKMRAPGGAMFLDFWRVFGADPVAMNWTEVFTALQQGTIDGHDNSLSTINSANVFEVQKYMTIANHMYEAFSFSISQKKFAALNEKTQQMIRDKMRQACLEINEVIVAEENKIKQKFMDAGVEFYTLTPEEIAAFKAVAKIPLIDKYKEKYGAAACAAFNIQ